MYGITSGYGRREALHNEYDALCPEPGDGVQRGPLKVGVELSAREALSQIGEKVIHFQPLRQRKRQAFNYISGAGVAVSAE